MAYTLSAKPRTVVGRQVKSLLQQRQIPAVLYGFQAENQSLQVEEGAFRKLLQAAGENQVVDLDVNGKTYHVLIREVQINPVRRDLIHVDFYSIDINVPVDVEVPLVFVGIAPAIKLSGGSLMKKMTQLRVRCLPKDFVKMIEVPVESLETIEDVITVADVKVPSSWTLLEEAEDVVAKVVPPRIETFDVKPADVEAAVVAAVNAVPAAEGEKAEAGKDGKAEGKKEAKK